MLRFVLSDTRASADTIAHALASRCAPVARPIFAASMRASLACVIESALAFATLNVICAPAWYWRMSASQRRIYELACASAADAPRR